MDNSPLLPSRGSGVVAYVRKTPRFVNLSKWIIKVAMWVLFISWVALIFLLPAEFGFKLFEKWVVATSGTVFGVAGSVFLLFSGPILIIALLAVVLFIISGEEELYENKTSRYPSFRLWTFPILVDGPFGVVSAAEFIGIFLFILYVLWAVCSYILRILGSMSDNLTFEVKSCLFLEILGLRLGSIGLFCFAFLFLPVARGSVLLRLINIPFEHATRYHVWLGHLTMLLFTVHGLLYLLAWTIEGRLLQQILEWKDIGVANLPGVISLLAGLLMWVTSFAPVRKLNFELFFYTHQLYVIFVIFLALHIGDNLFAISAGGIFIFLLDRFLRFCQSRRVVDIVSTKCLPCGTVELVLAKPENMRYNALSFVFLQVRELSWLQWHPFSVSSSPLDGKYHISVLIKVLGKWTENLRGNMLKSSEDVPTKITASVEGPYGHEEPYHMKYENLILVAGGIGISPFLAVLSDILHSVRQGKPCLPRNILVVWAIKTSDEIPLLSTIDMESSFSNKLNLQTHIYVTRETEPPLEEGKVQSIVESSLCPMSKGCGMSVLVGTGHNMWSGLYVISSTVGVVVLMGLLDICYINPFRIETWWYKGLLFIACMVASVFMFGGFVIGLWHLWDRRMSAKGQCDDYRINFNKAVHTEIVTDKNIDEKPLANLRSIHYGRRPDFSEIFGTVSKDWGYVDVGVIVCGPPTLQSSVAKEIRTYSLRRQCHDPIFHFNSHSFDL